MIESLVRPTLTIFLSPRFYLRFCILQCREPVNIQALVPQSSVEGFDVRIVRWFTGAGELHRHLVLIRPKIHQSTLELAAVVTKDPFGRVSACRNPGQHPNNIVTTQSLTRLD